jgi:hypothetical protein
MASHLSGVPRSITVVTVVAYVTIFLASRIFEQGRSTLGRDRTARSIFQPV